MGAAEDDCTLHIMPLYQKDNYSNIQIEVQHLIENSNMTWFFSPIKSTDTNIALLAR